MTAPDLEFPRTANADDVALDLRHRLALVDAGLIYVAQGGDTYGPGNPSTDAVLHGAIDALRAAEKSAHDALMEMAAVERRRSRVVVA